MNTNIKSTSLTLTPKISEYIYRRLEKIGKLVKDDPTAQCHIEVGLVTGHHRKGDIYKAEIHLIGAHKNAYSSVVRSDLFAAIDIVRDDIIRELSAGKSKHITSIRRNGAKIKYMVKGLWPWKKKF